MNSIQNDILSIKVFSKHFNSTLLISDFTENVRLFIDALKKKEQPKHKIQLPCNNIEELDTLIKFEYPELIKKLVENFKIEEECFDNCLSVMTEETLEFFQFSLSQMTRNFNISIDRSTCTIDINGPKALIAIIWSPISQVHTAFSVEFEHLSKMYKTTEKYLNMTSENYKVSDHLFLNSKVSNPFSYFILAFVAENLKIPLKV